MIVKNYRENSILINEQEMNIGGFADPVNKAVAIFINLLEEHRVNAVISLTGNYINEFRGADLDPKYYTSIAMPDWYDTPEELTKIIPASTFDAVYEAVCNAQRNGKKIAIHCGAGDGRTGTVLSSLKLRELLEKEFTASPKEFKEEIPASELIPFYYGARTGNGYLADATPIVKEAITAIRANDNVHHDSVESPNDVRSLVEYEKKLRKEIFLRENFKEGNFKEGNFKEGNFKEGNFKEENFKEENFKEENFKEENFKEVKKHYAYHISNDDKARNHFFHAKVESTQNVKEKLQKLKGDLLKSEILNDFKLQIANTNSKVELNNLLKEIKSSDEYKIIAKGQDVLTRMLHLKTSSLKAFETMIEEKEKSLPEENRQGLR